MTQKTVAIYCRVSTHGQSSERQERDLLQYAESAGFIVHAIFKEMTSGVKDDRIQHKNIMALAKARVIDAILATELTRWGRSTIRAFWHALIKAQVTYCCVHINRVPQRDDVQNQP